LNFHGKILSAAFFPESETIEEFEKKLLFRKNDYLQKIERKKHEFFPTKLTPLKKPENFSKIKKIMKKSYFFEQTNNSLTYQNHQVFLNQNHKRKIRIDLKK